MQFHIKNETGNGLNVTTMAIEKQGAFLGKVFSSIHIGSNNADFVRFDHSGYRYFCVFISKNILPTGTDINFHNERAGSGSKDIGEGHTGKTIHIKLYSDTFKFDIRDY